MDSFLLILLATLVTGFPLTSLSESRPSPRQKISQENLAIGFAVDRADLSYIDHQLLKISDSPIPSGLGCPEELSLKDPLVKRTGSIFLVKPDIVVMAGHTLAGKKVIRDRKKRMDAANTACSRMDFIFGNVSKDKKVENIRSRSCLEVIAVENDWEEGLDFAVVKVDPIKNIPPLMVLQKAGEALSEGQIVNVSTQGYLGYTGFQTDIKGQVIRCLKSSNEIYQVVTNQAILFGTSGSPVFATDLPGSPVIGINFAGNVPPEKPLVKDDEKNCYSANYPQNPEAQFTPILHVIPYIEKGTSFL